MAHVHYAYGNIEWWTGHLADAKRYYSETLRIALAETPIHPITAAAYYKLGCVEFDLNHLEVAKGYLDKARSIAELRSPTIDDGTIARILWMTARAMEGDPNVMVSAAAAEYRQRAEIARNRISGRGEQVGAPSERFDIETGEELIQDERDSYDVLVPGYFR